MPLEATSPPRWRPSLRPWLAAALAGLAVHIVATLIAPRLVGETPVASLQRKLPVNAMRVLPAVTPANQPLPFLGADARYAMCLFDLAAGPVAVSAALPEAGWSFAVYSANGEAFYAVPGVDERATEISLMLVPPGDRFIGLAGAARSGAGFLQFVAPTLKGVVVVRAPENGLAFARRVEGELARAACSPFKL